MNKILKRVAFSASIKHINTKMRVVHLTVKDSIDELERSHVWPASGTVHCEEPQTFQSNDQMRNSTVHIIQ